MNISLYNEQEVAKMQSNKMERKKRMEAGIGKPQSVCESPPAPSITGWKDVEFIFGRKAKN